MMFDYFDVLSLTGRPLGRIRLAYPAPSSPWAKRNYDVSFETSVDLKQIDPNEDFTFAVVHCSYEGDYSLWLQGRKIYDLRKVQLLIFGFGSEPGCKTCGHPGEFVRTALVCPTHQTFIGGI